MSEQSSQRPIKLGEETLTTMSLRTIGILGSLTVAVTGWALNQTLVGSRHTDQITEIQKGMVVLTKAMGREHEVLRDLQADKRELNLKLDYLVNGRRGPLPSTRSDPLARSVPSANSDLDPES